MELNETRHAGGFIKSEASGHRSREQVTIAEGESVVAGQVLGKVGVNEGAVTVDAAVFTGTGDGTYTPGTPAYGAGVMEGTYRVVCVEKTDDSGLFEVIRPDGTIDGQAVVGTAYNGQLKFTIADGSTDFAQGAAFAVPVTIAAADDEGEYKALDLSATDGAENAAAVAFDAYDASDAAVQGVAMVRDCELVAADLTWPDGISDNEKAAAIAQLADAGIIVR